jgi:hypothetical protein
MGGRGTKAASAGMVMKREKIIESTEVCGEIKTKA